MRYDVFISYSSDDQKVVEGLCAYLEERKIRCFVAYRDIPRGVVWAKAIVEALECSRMMVVVFSDNFNNSDQVDREIEIASEDKKPILTFRITEDAFKGAKKYYLKNLNWIDAFPHPESVFGSVAENVAKLLDIDLGESKPIQQVAKLYQVGDYYNENGKQGVVFAVWDNGQHGNIVSLVESGPIEWSLDKAEQKRLIRAFDEDNGANNMAKVRQIPDWQSKYPAFKWCADLGDGWYLPARDELVFIHIHKETINNAFSSLGAEGLDNKWYWSSTEYNYDSIIAEFCAWGVYMLNGSTGGNCKSYYYYVRAVSAF